MTLTMFLAIIFTMFIGTVFLVFIAIRVSDYCTAQRAVEEAIKDTLSKLESDVERIEYLRSVTGLNGSKKYGS